MKSQSVTPKPDADLARWCAVLSTQFAEDTVPEGWVTSKELANKIHRSPSRLSEVLQRAIAEGKCERKMFRVPNGGTVRPVPHYRLT